MKSRIIVLPLLIVGLFLPKTFSQTGQLTIHINPSFAGDSLKLGSKLYHVSNGDSLYIDALRFYITNIQLYQSNESKHSETSSYHLIDAEQPVSQKIHLQQMPVGQYTAISFTVGTDSITNVSGAMGGDLDPTLGMYWAWNTGYINLKMEGRSKSCNTRNQVFEFHIGGYLPPFQTLRKVVLPLKNCLVKKNEPTILNLKLDLAHFFDKISLKNTNQVMIPSKVAAQLADLFQSTWSAE